MNIKEIEIKNLRSLINHKIEFNKRTNIIYGKNGSGKTSILEAIHILCYTKSFRLSTKNSIRTKQKETMSVRGFFINDQKKLIKVEYNKYKDKNKITINKKRVNKPADIIGEIPCVVLSPEDIDILSGPNSNKLKYIDKILSTSNTKYLHNLIEFKKTLKQRNRLLKINPKQIEVMAWGEKLAETAINIWKERDVFFKEYQNKIQEQYKNIKLKGNVKVVYKKQTQPNKEDFLNKTKQNYLKDIKTQNTNIGPHKDVVEMYWDNKDMRYEASQGEKKLFLIALKKTEATYFYKKLNIKPIILLDDLFAKLDNKKCIKILSLFNNNFQTIITSTDNTVEPVIKKIKTHSIYIEKNPLCFAA